MPKRILDKETRKKLLGYVPFGPGTAIDFTPKQFEGVPDPSLRPVFKIRSLTQSERDSIAAAFSGLDKSSPDDAWLRAGHVSSEIRLKCVEGWEQFYDAGTGEEIPYSKDYKWSECRPVWLPISICEFVNLISGLTPEEKLSLAFSQLCASGLSPLAATNAETPNTSKPEEAA